MATSPTALSLRHLREAGYMADVVERWIPQARKRKDLFGFVDIVAVGGGALLFIQTTSRSNMAARRKKIAESPAAVECLRAGVRIEVHGWQKAGRLWSLCVAPYTGA